MKILTVVLRCTAMLALLGVGAGLTRLALAEGGCAKRPGPHCVYDTCGEGAPGCSKTCAQGGTGNGIGQCVGGLNEEQCSEEYAFPGTVWYYTGHCIDGHCYYDSPVSSLFYGWLSTDTSPCGS